MKHTPNLQPISTAPTDGTIIMGYWESTKHSETVKFDKTWYSWVSAGEATYPIVPPTHWTPISSEPVDLKNIHPMPSVLPTTHIDIWNNLVAVLLLPGIDSSIRRTALQYLTALNEAGSTGESISIAHNALQWCKEQFAG